MIYGKSPFAGDNTFFCKHFGLLFLITELSGFLQNVDAGAL